MVILFDRFTERARKSLVLAQEEAQISGHEFITEEHLFAGIIRDGQDGVAVKALLKLGLDPNELLTIVRQKLSQLPRSNGQSKMSASVKDILNNALRESLQMNKNYIGTEHLLLGLLRSGQSFVANLLITKGATIDNARKAVVMLVQEYEEAQNAANGNEIDPNLATAGPAGGRDKSGSQLLDQFGRDLTADARANKLDPVLNRDKEIYRVMQILSRRTKNNPILLGLAGVGKSAVVEGLAQYLLTPKAPKSLKDKIIYILDLSLVVSGTRYRGDFEERLKKIIKEIKNRGNIILFIDEIHTMLGAGSSEGGMDAGNILKPMLSRGELQVIGATTDEEYRKYFAKDAAMERRFQPVEIKQPTIEQTVQILKGLRDRYEEFHRVSLTDEALEAAVKLSDRYIPDRQLPDKAIDLMDEASARARLAISVPPTELNEATVDLDRIQKEKEEAINKQEFEQAAALRDEEEKIQARKTALEETWKAKEEHAIPEITDESIAQVLSDITGVAVTRMTEAENKKLIRMEKELGKRVIGQKEAIHALSRSIRRSRAGLAEANKPNGSFIFAGPTGTGKTELTKALAEFLYGSEENLIRFDMSEYGEKHTVSQLLGSPPGFVGFEDSGRLTREVKKHPNSVILFDEIEKAHPEIFNVFLQILDEGNVTDAQGTKIDFKNTTIIMTTNLGTKDVTNGPAGFTVGDEESNYDYMVSKVKSEMKKEYRPEFLNRVDETIVFHHLTEEYILSIVDLMVSRISKLVSERELTITLTKEAKAKLAKEGYSKEMGARPLRRTIQKHVEDVISELILLGYTETAKDIEITVEYTDDKDKVGKFLYNGQSEAEIELGFDIIEEAEEALKA